MDDVKYAKIDVVVMLAVKAIVAFPYVKFALIGCVADRKLLVDVTSILL